MRKACAIGLLALLGAAAPAYATEGLVWKWGVDEVRKYRLKTSMQLPLAILFLAEKNYQARVYDVDMALDVSCRLDRAAASSLDVLCDVDAAQFVASPEAQDAGRLPSILDEWDQKLVDDATIQLELGTDGRVKQVDLVGLNERIQRIRLIKETMHLMVTRAFSAFDLELPKKGDDGGGPWKQRSPMVAQLPVLTGMSGSVQIDSAVTGVAEGVATIDSTGRATLTVQPLIDGAPIAPDTYDMAVRSRSTFDVTTGNLTSRSCLAEGKMTPGSGSAMGRADAPYIHALELLYIPPGTPLDNLGPNVEKVPETAKE